MEENVPWGEDTLFTLEFREEANKYAVHTCTNMYLQTDGKLAPQAHKVEKKIRDLRGQREMLVFEIDKLFSL